MFNKAWIFFCKKKEPATLYYAHKFCGYTPLSTKF